MKFGREHKYYIAEHYRKGSDAFEKFRSFINSSYYYYAMIIAVIFSTYFLINSISLYAAAAGLMDVDVCIHYDYVILAMLEVAVWLCRCPMRSRIDQTIHHGGRFSRSVFAVLLHISIDSNKLLCMLQYILVDFFL